MVFALTSALLLVAALLTTGSVAMWTVIGIGLFNSIMWSNIFTLAIAGLGTDTSQAAAPNIGQARIRRSVTIHGPGLGIRRPIRNNFV